MSVNGKPSMPQPPPMRVVPAEPTLVAVPIFLMKKLADMVDKAGCGEPVFETNGDSQACGDEFPGAAPPYVVCEACKIRMEVGAVLAAFVERPVAGGLPN